MNLPRLLLFFICSNVCLFSTSQSVDSLKTVMKSNSSYSQKIKAYLTFEEKYGLQNFDEMLRIGNEGVELARNNGDFISVAEFQRFIGQAYYFKGQFEIAAKNYYSSINLLEKTGEKRKLALAYNELAKLYRKTRDLSRSLETYDKALVIFKYLNDRAGIAMIMNESGVVFEYAEQYAKAIERYSASLQINKVLKDSIGIAYALSNIAGVYTIQKKYDIAEEYLLQVLQIRKILKDSFALALTYSDISTTYAAMNSFSIAKNFIDTSNQIADRMNYPELKQNNYALLADMAKKTGDYQIALNYYQKSTAIRDSLFTLSKTKQIEELNTQYETVKKEQKIKEQQDHITQQNILIIGAALLSILIILLAYTQYRRTKWKQEAKMQLAILKQQELATKAVLEAEENERIRIAKDLHDGIGQMMSVAKMNLSTMEEELNLDAGKKIKMERIISLVDESCKELRSVSHNLMPNALLKAGLAAAVREFIEKIDSQSLQIDLHSEGLQERMDADTETVLYRIIQECVNNVIKHSAATRLDISLINDEDGISVTVEDNGKGFNSSALEKFEGIGLKNMKTRSEYLKGTIEINSTPDKGTLVAIHIPAVNKLINL